MSTKTNNNRLAAAQLYYWALANLSPPDRLPTATAPTPSLRRDHIHIKGEQSRTERWNHQRVLDQQLFIALGATGLSKTTRTLPRLVPTNSGTSNASFVRNVLDHSAPRMNILNLEVANTAIEISKPYLHRVAPAATSTSLEDLSEHSTSAGTQIVSYATTVELL